MISFQQYYAKLIEAGAIGVLPDKGKLPHVDHIASLKATLMVNKELMDNPQIRKILTAIICFEPDSINPEILALVCGIEREKVDELISILDNYSLVNIQEDNRLSIHRLMREALSEQIPQEEIQEMQKNYVIQLGKWFVEHNKVDTLKITTPEIPHVLGAAKLALEDNLWPQSYALCIVLGKYYWFMGRYQQYLGWAQKSEKEVKNKAPNDSAKLALSYNEIGTAWNLLGEYKKAISYFEQALSLYKEVHGAKHPYVATGLNNLGAAWDDLGEYKKAIGYYEQALDIWKEAYGKKHPQVAIGLNNLGLAWDSLEQYKKAIGYFEQALSIDQEYYGERHPDVAIDLNNLGAAWDSLGEHDKARAYQQQAYSIFVEFLGEEHHYTKETKAGLEGLPG